MNANDAERQINQMIAFIAAEAREKVEEINVKTASEFNADKLSRVTQARLRLKEEYDSKEKQVEIQNRIARSKELTGSRFSQMQARDNVVKNVKVDTLKRLEDIGSHASYPALLRALMVEALTTMLETRVVNVECRACDRAIVEREMPAAYEEFMTLIKTKTGVAPTCTVVVSDVSLPPSPKEAGKAVCCHGGVRLTARHGKIVCDNTLETRLSKAFDALKPAIRTIMFGENEVASAKAADATGAI